MTQMQDDRTTGGRLFAVPEERDEALATRGFATEALAATRDELVELRALRGRVNTRIRELVDEEEALTQVLGMYERRAARRNGGGETNGETQEPGEGS